MTCSRCPSSSRAPWARTYRPALPPRGTVQGSSFAPKVSLPGSRIEYRANVPDRLNASHADQHPYRLRERTDHTSDETQRGRKQIHSLPDIVHQRYARGQVIGSKELTFRPQNSLSVVHTSGTHPWRKMKSAKLRLIAPLDACSCCSICGIAATLHATLIVSGTQRSGDHTHECKCSRQGRSRRSRP